MSDALVPAADLRAARAALDFQPDAEQSMFDLTVALAALEERVTEYLATMPAAAVPATLYEITNWRKALDRIEDVVEAKAEAVWSEAVPLGGAWKGPDGEHYDFRTPRARKTTDINGLRADLIMAARANNDEGAMDLIAEAFPIKRSMRLTELDTLAAKDPGYKSVIQEYVIWADDGRPHLRKVETSRKRPSGTPL